MELNRRIYETFADEADRSLIDEIHIGLAYTAVTLSDGRCGVCATLADQGCITNHDQADYEGRSALQLLRHIHEDVLLTRVMAVALVNALNQPFTKTLPEDNRSLVDTLGLFANAQVAMVGYFAPVASRLEQSGIRVRAYDRGKKIGEKKDFYAWASKEADALIITATTIVNNTLEEVLKHFHLHSIPTVLMGPSTIMEADIYGDLPISLLAGTAVIDTYAVLKAIRNARGTIDIHRYSRKVILARNRVE